MSNSPLVSYTRISPNKTVGRRAKIDTITIHCVVGQLSVETIGQVFAPSSRQASSNYAIGADGRVGMYVEEKDRSWCTSSGSNDNRAVTIECASGLKPPYAITQTVYNSLIKLLVDICKRNGIKELKWKNDKSLIGQIDKQNMTVHRWFANTACPGEDLMSKMGQIASDTNKLLKGGKLETPKFEPHLVRITASGLNVRKDPSINSEILYFAKQGDVFMITDVKKGPGSSNGWGKLRVRQGWISLDYVEKVE